MRLSASGYLVGNARRWTPRFAIERGIPAFDFLRGEEPYKYAFGPEPADLFNVRVAP